MGVTEQIAPDLANPGLVTAAVVTDLLTTTRGGLILVANNDGPIKVFKVVE